MITSLIVIGILAVYATIGTLYGAWLYAQLQSTKYPDEGKISCYPWDEEGMARTRGILWPPFLLLSLARIPGKHIASIGIKLGERSLRLQREAIKRRVRIADEQNKLRIETQQLEAAAEREAEECMQQSNHL